MLDARPPREVVVALSIEKGAGDHAAYALSDASLTFAPSAWNVSQTVSVALLDDDIDQGDREVRVLFAHSSPAEDGALPRLWNATLEWAVHAPTATAFDGAAASTRVLVAEDDAAGIVASTAFFTAGFAAAFFFKLDCF